MVVKGGGILHTYKRITDIYYLYYSLFNIMLAHRLGKKVIIMPNSFGPFLGKFEKYIVKKVLSKCDLIYAREDISRRYLQDLLGVDIACDNSSNIDEHLCELGCKNFELEFKRNPLSRSNIIAYRKLKKLLRENEYDVIHTHTPVASFFARLASKKFENIKVIYTAHGFHFFKGASIRNWALYYPIERYLAKYTDAIITMNNEDFKNANKFKLRRGGKVYKVNGVGVNLSKFSPRSLQRTQTIRNQYGFSVEDFILIYVAELSKRKNQIELIYSIKYLKEYIPSIKLLLVGNGNLFDFYSSKILELGIEENVKLLGYRRDIPTLMQMSDIAVSTSKQEGLPVNIMEAMAMGLPLVVTNARGNIDLVDDGINGFVVNKSEINQLVSKINVLYKSKHLIKKFSEYNVKVVQKYSVDRVLEEMSSIYDELGL